jgi:hypothetical protein
MGLEMNKPGTPDAAAGVAAGRLIADRRLFLTADQRVVEEGDPNAAIQLAAPGGFIEPAEVRRLGLELKDGKISQKAAPGGVLVPGGALLDPRGAVEAAVKDRLKADWEVRVKEETDREMERIKGEVGEDRNAYPFALNRAGVMSREALQRRGEAAGNPDADRSAAVVEDALKSAPKSQKDAEGREGKSGTKKARKRSKR